MKTTILFSLLILLGAGCATPDSTTDNSKVSLFPLTNQENLSGQGLTEIPKEVLESKNLVDLDISHNAIDGALPSEMNRLKKLRHLDASYNQMTGIPAEIGQLTELEILNFSHNQLTGIPHELANLESLKILDLRGNTISKQDLDFIQKRLENTQILVDETL